MSLISPLLLIWPGMDTNSPLLPSMSLTPRDGKTAVDVQRCGGPAGTVKLDRVDTDIILHGKDRSILLGNLSLGVFTCGLRFAMVGSSFSEYKK